jgi:hypothetical protein
MVVTIRTIVSSDIHTPLIVDHIKQGFLVHQIKLNERDERFIFEYGLANLMGKQFPSKAFCTYSFPFLLFWC